MFRSLIPVLYVRVSAERLVVTNAKTGESLSEMPELAITRNPGRILAFGSAARSTAAGTTAVVINPFSHPRSLVSDFTSAEQLLKLMVRRLHGKAWFSPSPRVVIHPLGDPDGGFTQVERRAFREMALGAGAAEVVVWTGRELTNHEVVDGTFPAGGVAE
jgi:rod shape-determining protein MreB and related proteins